ncbi:MAG TPA: hypothetical protein VJI12_00680 [archaeon]|nr:hypothetical protein [archaeon]
MANDFYRQLGTGVSSLTFGVALSVFIYAAASVVSGFQAWLLFATSFLLMLRFWWRYNELFVQFLPSRTFWHFLFDFAVSFFGILSVLSVGNMAMWAMLSALAMLSSAVRCGLSWRGTAGQKLKRTLYGAVGMLVIFGIVYALAPLYSQLHIAAAVFAVVLVFVVYSSRKP